MSKDTGISITSAERYSLALYELSTESSVTSQIEEQSLSILKLLEQSQDFSNLIKEYYKFKITWWEPFFARNNLIYKVLSIFKIKMH